MPFRIRDLLITIDPTQGRSRDECELLLSLCLAHSPAPTEPLANAAAADMLTMCTACPKFPSPMCEPGSGNRPPGRARPTSEGELAELEAQVRAFADAVERTRQARSDPAKKRALTLAAIDDLERRFTEAIEELREKRREIERPPR